MADRTASSAFVPGHITGFFTVHRTDDPLESGSRGAGLTLTDGVTVEVRPTEEPTVEIDGEPVDIESVTRVLDALDVDAAVSVETDLPLGSGFGLSGGMALGTALAANEVFDLARTENELTSIAHRAEVEAGTGLGDVVAQARGGMPIRVEPGGPSFGELDGIPVAGRIECLTFGELSTPDILQERPGLITEAGSTALESLLERPTADRFMVASREFADSVGLVTPAIDEVFETVDENGGTASMAMLGETVFALGTDLSGAGYDPLVSAIDVTGGTLLE